VYEVLAVRYASRQTLRSEVFLNYAVYGEPDAPIGMDYFFWVIRDQHRTVLVDCGFDPVVGARRGREVLCPPLDAVRMLGIEPGQVDLLIVTHAHYDHIGNLAAFPDTPLLASAAELEFWSGSLAHYRQFAAVAEQPELDALALAARSGRVTTFTGEIEPIPGISVIEVGGHTPGQSIVAVDVGGGRTVVLASDASHYYEEAELRRPFAFTTDLPAMYRGFERLSAIADDPDCEWIPGHDPLVMSRFPSCEGPLAELAVRLG
jgi:glyoxylase-like metal-dependent hydrolase (beta-lactamase superfamily II)